jgi:hypothetical protein
MDGVHSPLFILKHTWLNFCSELYGKFFLDIHDCSYIFGKNEVALLYNWLEMFRLSASAWNTEEQNQYQDTLYFLQWSIFSWVVLFNSLFIFYPFLLYYSVTSLLSGLKLWMCMNFTFSKFIISFQYTHFLHTKFQLIVFIYFIAFHVILNAVLILLKWVYVWFSSFIILLILIINWNLSIISCYAWFIIQ